MANSPIASFGLLIVFLALMYFMLIRPQKKKEKEDKEMRNQLQVGDEIMTIGGVIGKIVKINDKSIIITTGAEKNKIEFVKTAVASVSKATANAPKSPKIEPSDDVKGPEKDKKVTPKKLSKKSEEK